MKLKTSGLTDDQVRQITKERVAHHWGQPSTITPYLVGKKHGNGLQLVYLCPLATRPNYYVMQVDSSVDLGNEEHEGQYIGDLLLDLVMSECLDIDNFEWQESGLYVDSTDDTVKPFLFQFPMLSLSCGYSYGGLEQSDLMPGKPTT